MFAAFPLGERSRLAQGLGMLPARILSLQILRFVAATAVIWLHACFNLHPDRPVDMVAFYGAFGVDLFFVLSGVIIAKVAPGCSAGSFIRQRLTRILPLYWVLTLTWMGVLIVVGVFTTPSLGTSLLLYPSIHPQYLTVAWTLQFELLFYFSVALVLIRPKAALAALAVVYVSAFIARSAFGGPVLNVIGSPLIVEFGAGVVIARMPRSRAALALAAAAAIVSLYAIALGHYYGAPPNVVSEDRAPLRLLFYGVPAALIVYVALNLQAKGRIAERLGYLGDASYAAYLVHFPLIILMVPIASGLPLMIGAPVVIAFCWLFAILVHEAIEKPLLSVCRRRWIGRSVAAPHASSDPHHAPALSLQSQPEPPP